MKSSVTSLDTVVTFDGSTSTLEQSSKGNNSIKTFKEIRENNMLNYFYMYN